VFATGIRVARPFECVIAAGFYDGPEDGFAIRESGEGFRFDALGDSRSRFFRAFSATKLKGDWWPLVKALPDFQKRSAKHSVILVSQKSDALSTFENAVAMAIEESTYIAVGSSYLEWLYFAPVSKHELADIVDDRKSNGFPRAHQFIKASREKIGEK
jgi:hypothetical protein